MSERLGRIIGYQYDLMVGQADLLKSKSEDLLREVKDLKNPPKKNQTEGKN